MPADVVLAWVDPLIGLVVVPMNKYRHVIIDFDVGEPT